jgi:hypothetical protein
LSLERRKMGLEQEAGDRGADAGFSIRPGGRQREPLIVAGRKTAHKRHGRKLSFSG